MKLGKLINSFYKLSQTEHDFDTEETEKDEEYRESSLKKRPEFQFEKTTHILTDVLNDDHKIEIRKDMVLYPDGTSEFLSDVLNDGLIINQIGWTVFGPLASNKIYNSSKSAREAKDKLDNMYGANRHHVDVVKIKNTIGVLIMKSEKIFKLADLFVKSQRVPRYASVEGRDYRVTPLGKGSYRVERLIGGNPVTRLDFSQTNILSRSGDTAYEGELRKDMYNFPNNIFELEQNSESTLES